MCCILSSESFSWDTEQNKYIKHRVVGEAPKNEKENVLTAYKGELMSSEA